MQKKNILIAILCATILMLVPFTSISSASVSGSNTKVEVIEDTYSVIQEYIQEELHELINLLLLNYGHIPQIVAVCNELLELISPDYPGDAFCFMLLVLIRLTLYVCEFIWYFLLEQGYVGPITWFLYLSFLILAYEIYFFGIKVNCWDYGEPTFFKSETGLNLQTILNSISQYDITTIQKLTKLYEVKGCHCIQE